jgi:hypothetical protein
MSPSETVCVFTVAGVRPDVILNEVKDLVAIFPVTQERKTRFLVAVLLGMTPR